MHWIYSAMIKLLSLNYLGYLFNDLIGLFINDVVSQLWVVSLYMRIVPILWSAAQPEPVCPVAISMTLRKSESSTQYISCVWSFSILGQTYLPNDPLQLCNACNLGCQGCFHLFPIFLPGSDPLVAWLASCNDVTLVHVHRSHIIIISLYAKLRMFINADRQGRDKHVSSVIKILPVDIFWEFTSALKCT